MADHRRGPAYQGRVLSIHGTDPFADPEGARSPVRRLRGRLPTAVTLWTSPGPAGLTVSSTVIANGSPGRLLGLIDEESELWSAIEAGGRFAVIVLTWEQRHLADRFAGQLPAPGGVFSHEAWRQTAYGPVPDRDVTWAGCLLSAARPYGWGLLVEGIIDEIAVGSAGAGQPLVHYRGRYRAMP